MNKTALINGVTGQDGSYLAELLLKKGYFVVGLIRKTSLFNTIEEACEQILALRYNRDHYDKIRRSSIQEFSKKYKKNNMINKLVNIYNVQNND